MTSGDEKHFGPGWDGWESYRLFKQSVKADLRYVRHKNTDDLLDQVLASRGDRERTIPRGWLCWRARIGCETEEVERVDDDTRVVYDEDRPYGQQGMKPIPNWQREGRANPRGIPYLYLGTSRDTALAEVRPWIGSIVSVAQFEIIRELRVIDCSKHHQKDALLSVLTDKSLTRADGMWMAIDQAFATPVSREDEGGEYISTQIIAELFKREGFDGIAYKSLLSDDGFNVALFNLDDARVINCALYRAASLKFEFQPDGVQYFVRDQGMPEE
jgi:hypothetical protein